jgi:hypothetical protein
MPIYRVTDPVVVDSPPVVSYPLYSDRGPPSSKDPLYPDDPMVQTGI